MYPQVFGKYVLERELSRGGMARVVLATLRGAGGFEKKLVVKQIRDELACDDEFVRRFVEEAKTTVALAHPNIVPVYELGVERGTYFLAMELVEGVSVAELLRASSPQRLLPEEGAYIGVEVCRALDYAHRRMNLVHRDVTPRNVMVDEEGQVKVIDFGIAAPVATAPSGHGIFGSPGHMPPEQMEGGELTAAADVFAVAVLLMELWSGKAPFRRRTTHEVEASMRAAHPKASEANIRLLSLDEVMASAMSSDAKLRPQQADDLARALRRFLAGVDLGDLARQLGGRVRDVRAHPLPAPAEAQPVLQRPPSRPTATQVGTKTFAAREEVRSLESKAPLPEVSTRRIASVVPLAVARRQRWVWFAASAASALAITAFFLGRGAASTETRSRQTAPASTESVAAIATTSPSTTSAPASPTPPLSATAARATATAIASAERAELVLLGDGTLVRVDGMARGRCPTQLVLDPGRHSVVFSFPATGESKAESLTLHAGEHATVRADFTTASPTIRVQR
jgi:tRNA A-37 threonylcarbamoyl transferase component Bud32